MASSYPGGLDAFANPTASDPLNSATVPHATQHANANDAIEAIQAELGTDPAGASATVKARFDVIEAAGWVTSTRILDGTIVDGDINAAAAIAQSKVANLTTDLAAKAPLASPTFTGTVTTPLTTAGYVKTDSGGVLSSSAAIAQADVTNLTSDLAGKAPLESPAFTGTGTSPALKVTNTGTGASLLIEDAASTDSTPVIVDASGNVGLGTTTPAALLHVDGGLIFAQRYAAAGGMVCRRANGSAGSPTATTAAEPISVFLARAYDGTSTYRDVGGLYFYSSQTCSPTQSGGYFSVQITPDGSTTATERLRINSTGNVGIGTNSTASKVTVAGGDVEVTDIASGIILKSPDGTRYRVTVANGGTLNVAAV